MKIYIVTYFTGEEIYHEDCTLALFSTQYCAELYAEHESLKPHAFDVMTFDICYMELDSPTNADYVISFKSGRRFQR